jgi:GNAT superfamily N-acetyltransferase
MFISVLFQSLWRKKFLSHHRITVRSALEADLSEIVDLIIAQQTRQRTLDPRLPHVQMRAHLHEGSHQEALVALDEEGHVRGYGQPAVWEIKPTSILRAFLTARNGIVRTLTLPHPADEDAGAVATALLSAFSTFWQHARTSGDLVRWPSTDGWVEAALTAQGLRLDSICALRSLEPLLAVRPTPGSQQRVRMARPDDEDSLVELFHEELQFHERSLPFVRSSPEVLATFRHKLRRMWEGDALDVLEAGAPVVLVVEYNKAVVAMAENTLLIVAPGDEPGYTSAGCYWCLDNVSVREALHGQGIGRLLMQGVEDVREELGLLLDGSILWYNPDNPKAARFWTGLGFQPLWTTYQRLRVPLGDQPRA